MKTGITLFLAILLIAFHIWACRRRPKFWCLGGIVPLIWFSLLAFLALEERIHMPQDLRVILFPSLILPLIWLEGHQIAKKKELDRMKANDLV